MNLPEDELICRKHKLLQFHILTQFLSIFESEWQNLLAALAENQELLMQTISDKAEELLETKVGSRNYSFRLMLNGIIHHDIYHIGQISIVRKLVL